MASFRAYITDLMNERRDLPADRAMKGLLSGVSSIYGAGAGSVDLFYKAGIKRAAKAPVPVISLGNITLGGTGKTPMAIFIARRLLAMGRKPAILMRGYGGDEDRMIREGLPEVPVYASPDRVRSVHEASGQGCDSAVLDDGFQHRRIGRDLDILLIDGTRLFGNGRLFPRGPLREKVGSVSRADILVLTKMEGVGEEKRREIRRKLNDLAPGKPLVIAKHSPVCFRDITGLESSPESVRGTGVCLLSGIADPGHFASMVRGLGADIISSFDLGDHHRYTRDDIDNVSRECSRMGISALITTEKDHVKIRELGLPQMDTRFLVLKIGIEITEGEEILIDGLNSVFAGQRA